MEENKNALDEVNKGCTMGIEAINNLLKEVSSESFNKTLVKEVESYQKIEGEIHDIYDKYSEGTPHEIGTITKVMTDYMMKTKTMMDHTDSKIAELLSQGTNMGIIEGQRILNNKNLNSEVKNLIQKFVKLQEKSLEDLKKYL